MILALVSFLALQLSALPAAYWLAHKMENT